jgi:hypothetical protein
VGGTVGGIAAIGLVGLGAWFLVLRSRERKESTYQHSMYQPSMSQQPTPHSPTTTVGGYMAAQEQLDRRENFQTQTQPQLYHQHT